MASTRSQDLASHRHHILHPQGSQAALQAGSIPLEAAQCRAVRPSASRVSGARPGRRSKSATRESQPCCTARCTAVRPLLALLRAPSRTIATTCSCAAACLDLGWLAAIRKAMWWQHLGGCKAENVDACLHC